MTSNGHTENSYGTHKWWKEAIVYQIYPASFLSTGAGTIPGWGDIRGITSKVDYIKDLGADVVWLSPIYKSPQADMGYDISDYNDIDPRYGSLADVDELIEKLHSRGMKLMMDLVVNHTSTEHAWFLDSRSSKTAKKRDWYIWQPAKYDADGHRQPPNNWMQILGTAYSAWTWDEHTQEYYLALFTPEQPDLNWRNPDVRAAVFDVLKFWLKRGVSGFRMDVINMISKVEGYPDAPITIPGAPYQPGTSLYSNGPHMHEYLREMRRETLDKFDTITVGEMPFIDDTDEILQTVGANEGELNMIFIFDIVNIDNASKRMTVAEWKLPKLRNIFNRWQRTMYERNGWNSVFIENHDNPRSISRYADDSDEYRERSAKMLSLMLTTMGGTLYVFQGQELGQRNVPQSWQALDFLDIETVNYWKSTLEKHPGDEKAAKEARFVIQRKARDHSRTPVQWNKSANAGFSSERAKPWMKVNDDYKTVNAAAQLADSSSVLHFWTSALKRRKTFKDVFVYGSFDCLDDEHDSVFAYKRTSAVGDAWIVLLNFSKHNARWNVPSGVDVHGFVESTYGDARPEKDKVQEVVLRPWEGVIGRLTA